MSDRIQIRDPIHGSMPMESWTIPLIDHPRMQRLRRVRQLGFANLVYPGANHSRFEHCLGAYHLAGRFASAVKLDETDSNVLRAAALVHDIGHGPFSHSFERVTGTRHEILSTDLIRWGPLADLLRQGGIHPPDVADAVQGKGKLSGIVSGALDADRMDYLLRDAHYTGVKVTVDPDRLFASAQILPNEGLVLRESGILAAEALLTTRFNLYPSVYLHHGVRSAEGMLIRALRHAIKAGELTAQGAAEWDDERLIAKLRDGVGGDLVERILIRRLHKRACRIRVSPALLERKPWKDEAFQEKLALEIAEAAGVKLDDVIVDFPKPPQFLEAQLKILARDGSISTLHERSNLVQSLQRSHEDHYSGWVFSRQATLAKVAEASAEILKQHGLDPDRAV